MAATRLIALHKNKGKSVSACLKDRTDYAQNPDKTAQGETGQQLCVQPPNYGRGVSALQAAI